MERTAYIGVALIVLAIILWLLAIPLWYAAFSMTVVGALIFLGFIFLIIGLVATFYTSTPAVPIIKIVTHLDAEIC